MKLYSKLKTAGQIILIPQEKIMPNPSQPRKSYNKEELEGLAGSIKENGILQPLNVRANGTGEYELISGERRLRAARLAGFPSVPCVIMDTNEKTSAVFALIENMQRQDLNYFEEAAAIERLSVKHGLMQEDIAKLLGKSQSALSNKIRLLKLPEDMRIKIINAGLTERHARALLRLENDESRLKVFSTIVEKHLNVAETDKMVYQILTKEPSGKKTPVKLFKDIRVFINTLNHAVETMKKAGIIADSIKNENSDYIEYTVKIKKSEDENLIYAKL